MLSASVSTSELLISMMEWKVSWLFKNTPCARHQTHLLSGKQSYFAYNSLKTKRLTVLFRWSLATAPQANWSATGYFYGKPSEFDQKLKPLLARLPASASLTKTETDFWTLETQVAGGMNLPNGGAGGPGRAFYGQALTTTTDNPLTYESVYALFNYTTFAFNRTDLRKSGLLDLWGGVSSEVSDADTSYAHGNNLWLIRWDANAVDATAPYPADGKPILLFLALFPMCIFKRTRVFIANHLSLQASPISETKCDRSKRLKPRKVSHFADSSTTATLLSPRRSGVPDSTVKRIMPSC